MKQVTFTLLMVCGLAISGLKAQSDLFIDTTYTAEQMVMDFFNNSMVTPTNITFNGAPASLAFFEAADTDLGIPAGIFICTGNVWEAADSVTSFASEAHYTPGDTDLEAELGGQFVSHDAAVLEFDIVSADTVLDFTYVFGSEEYPEYVGSNFNDAFAFYISDTLNPTPTNIAMIPNASIPVAINNVNGMMNSEFYVPNDTLMGEHIVYDGFTTPLPASYTATPNHPYHVKIAVADMGDHIFDSGVFISIGSLGGNDTLQPPADAMAAVNGNTVSVENLSRYATSWFWDFGDGFTTTERYPAPHTYAQDGLYTITLTTENWCCSDTYSIDVQIGEVINNTNDLQAIPFELFPNPATDYLSIRAPFGQVLRYDITDVSGRLFLSGQFEGTQDIQLKSLNPGIYNIRISSDSGTSVKRFLVKG